ncbi:MAG: TOBE domain-containing protein [Sutterellaceae bacterium]|nr:TOBE domain-containing protein [Sutterellaceae bacterium]MDD7441860.1 TOBE domain-containing protein [Sutterellaceae bacterium]MDY2867710.1 TOBE domain-containing protein [Mesosutterella sp.]
MSLKKTLPSDPKREADPVEFTRTLATLSDRRIDILRRIEETGSISEAARAAGVSYKAAWQAIETLENLAGGKLVEKSVGGSRGGGTHLTETGRTALVIADRIAEARSKVLKGFTKEEMSLAGSISPSAGVLTSMRNNLPCTVEDVRHGPALVRVTLKLDEENSIRASVTQESAQLLGLEPGARMIAAAKATAVEISRGFSSFSESNVLRGTVIRCARSEKGGEVALRLPSGIVVVGFARHNHGLRVGMPAEASIPPNAVVVARVS